jgi:tetratricopeptide (TPR) repeat protein
VHTRLALAQGHPVEAADAFREYHVDPAPQGMLSRTQLEFDLSVAEIALALKDPARAAAGAASVRERVTTSPLAKYLRGTEARAAYCEGRARLALGDASAALSLLSRAAVIRREDLSPASPVRLQAETALAEVYAALGRAEDAQRALEEARAVAARTPHLGPQYTQALERSARAVASR